MKKKVSSTAGHQLMHNNVYAPIRYKQANYHVVEIINAMNYGDLERFGAIVEEEALTLHALMMTSTPSYILMVPNTLKCIELVRDFRVTTKIPLYFTLDAGPNLHLLYPDEAKVKVKEFISNELKPLCENGRIIEDFVGIGAEKL